MSHRRGLGLIEVLLAACCLLLAVLPLTSLFSFNIDSSRTLYQRSVAQSAALELWHQLATLDPAALPPGRTDLTAPREGEGAADDPLHRLRLSPLPKGFVRTLDVSIVQPGQLHIGIAIRTSSSDQQEYLFQRTLQREVRAR